MNLEKHALLTGTLLIIYFWLNIEVTIPAALGFIFFGILIDIDHFIDIYYNTKKIILNSEEIRKTHRKSKKLFVLFHSWELIPFLLISAYLYSPVFLYYSIVYTLHLISDNLTNDVKPLAYSLIWRYTQNFEGALIHRNPIIDNALEAYGAVIFRIMEKLKNE